ncbi:MAG: hypothetical protein D3909_09695 [Candidatus Electrothrix sp. ATG1]|nr:hypothetical protein [Candidatus Electrothrix sp. ATG1]
MKLLKEVFCQGASSISILHPFILPFFFFLLAVLAPLSSRAEGLKVTSPTAGEVWHSTLSPPPESYTISGKTKKADGTTIPNATITFTGLSSVQSISNGVYSQTVPDGWSGSVCASKNGCDFACVSVFNITTDKSGVDLICEEHKQY